MRTILFIHFNHKAKSSMIQSLLRYWTIQNSFQPHRNRSCNSRIGFDWYSRWRVFPNHGFSNPEMGRRKSHLEQSPSSHYCGGPNIQDWSIVSARLEQFPSRRCHSNTMMSSSWADQARREWVQSSGCKSKITDLLWWVDQPPRECVHSRRC